MLDDQTYKLFVTEQNKKLVFWMICILIKCSASLFSHTVQYASAPVALKLHPPCCYSTVLEVSAGHITSLHGFHHHHHLHIQLCTCYLSKATNVHNTEHTSCLYIEKPTLTYFRIVLNNHGGKKSMCWQYQSANCACFFIMWSLIDECASGQPA